MIYAFTQLTRNWLYSQTYISISEMKEKFSLPSDVAASFINEWLSLKLIERDVTCPGLFKVIEKDESKYNI